MDGPRHERSRRRAPLRRVAVLLIPLVAATFLAVTGSSAAPASSPAKNFQLIVSETTSYTSCPPGTSAGIVCAQGNGTGHSATLGTVSESFVSQIDLAQPDPSGNLGVVSIATLTLATGNELILSAQGSYNSQTGSDSEVFQVQSGTGALASVRGSGTAQTVSTGQNGAATTSTTTYNGSLTGYPPFLIYFPLIHR